MICIFSGQSGPISHLANIISILPLLEKYLVIYYLFELMFVTLRKKLETNTKPQTISLVNNISKLFWETNILSLRDSILLFELKPQSLEFYDFSMWNLSLKD